MQLLRAVGQDPRLFAYNRHAFRNPLLHPWRSLLNQVPVMGSVLAGAHTYRHLSMVARLARAKKSCQLTIHSSRRRFPARLNSGVRRPKYAYELHLNHQVFARTCSPEARAAKIQP